MNTLAGIKEGTFSVLTEVNGKEQSFIIAFDEGSIQKENEYRDSVFKLHELTQCETGQKILFQMSAFGMQDTQVAYSGGIVTSISVW
jgi:hypothetical protein